MGNVCKEDRKTIKAVDAIARNLPYLGLENVQAQTGQIICNPEDMLNDGGKSSTFLFDNRHILYGKLRPYLNKVAAPDLAGRCTTELVPILPTLVTRDYLLWLLRRPESVSYAMQGRTGSRMPRTNMKDFMQMDIPLPPLEEQNRIASIIGQRMAARERAKEAAHEQLDTIDALQSALLRQTFSGAIQ